MAHSPGPFAPYSRLGRWGRLSGAAARAVAAAEACNRVPRVGIWAQPRIASRHAFLLLA